MRLIRIRDSSTGGGSRRAFCWGRGGTRSIFWWGSIASCRPSLLSLCSLGLLTEDRPRVAAKSILFVAIFSTLLIATQRMGFNRLMVYFACSSPSIFYHWGSSGVGDWSEIYSSPIFFWNRSSFWTVSAKDYITQSYRYFSFCYLSFSVKILSWCVCPSPYHPWPSLTHSTYFFPFLPTVRAWRGRSSLDFLYSYPAISGESVWGSGSTCCWPISNFSCTIWAATGRSRPLRHRDWPVRQSKIILAAASCCPLWRENRGCRSCYCLVFAAFDRCHECPASGPVLPDLSHLCCCRFLAELIVSIFWGASWGWTRSHRNDPSRLFSSFYRWLPFWNAVVIFCIHT